MKFQTVDLLIKAAGPDDDLQEGEFLGYASIFGNIDSYGDMVMPGAFTDTLKAWDDSGNVLPVLWGHDMHDPFSNIGGCVEANQDTRGLLVRGLLDLDNPKAKQVYRLIKGRRVNQMSFAYDVLEGSYVETRDELTGETQGYYELRKLKLYEVSIVPIGANQETELLTVKGLSILDGVKAGRILSAKNEGILKDAHQELTDAAQRIGEVLAQVSTEEEKASTTPAVKSEEPDTAKVEEQPVDQVSVDSESDQEEDGDAILLEQLGYLAELNPSLNSEGVES